MGVQSSGDIALANAHIGTAALPDRIDADCLNVIEIDGQELAPVVSGAFDPLK
jgi:hypothetical protein